MLTLATLLDSSDTRWIGRLVALLAVGASLYVAAAIWAGSAQTWHSIETIGVPALLVGTAASSSSYLFRFLRWQSILGSLGHRLPVSFSLCVYLAGFALTTSPAKLGETLRSALLLPRGVSVPQSLAAFFADRLADVIGVALLGATAGFLANERQPFLEILAALMFAVGSAASAIVRSPWWSRVLHAIDTGNRIGRIVTAVAAPASAWAQVWLARRVLPYALTALLAFGIQGLVFAAYVGIIAPQLDAVLCVAMFASSTLIGAASMIPGGLGAMEAAMVVQLHAHGVPFPDAFAAVAATRASTLWFSMTLGATMLLGLGGTRAPRAKRCREV